MPIKEQQALAAKLASFEFDMAIDMAENESSRRLLYLSGAPVLVGFPSGLTPGLSIEVGGFTHDRWNGHEIVPHTNKLLGLVEWLGAMLRSEPNVVKREDIDPKRLTALGLRPGVGFAVLHDGARLQFSRWPHYHELASLILARTNLNVISLTDDVGAGARLPEALAHSERFRLINGLLPFDDFDALVSDCTVFCGQ